MSDRFLHRRKVFVISAGRTGTAFLAKALPDVLNGCFAVHEPDTVRRTDLVRPGTLALQVSRQGGVVRQVILKALGRTGARNLSLMRVAGRITREEALARFLQDRRWTDRHYYSLYVETNQQLYGLADDLTALPASQVVVIVRHPESWLESCLNYQAGWYGPRDLLQKIDLAGMRRLAPKHAGEPCPDWAHLDQSGRLIWLWNFVNRRLIRAAQSRGSRIALFRYEDLFVERLPAELRRFLRTVDPDCELEGTARALTDKMSFRINASERSRSEQSTVTDKHREMIERVCGITMSRVGYA